MAREPLLSQHARRVRPESGQANRKKRLAWRGANCNPPCLHLPTSDTTFYNYREYSFAKAPASGPLDRLYLFGTGNGIQCSGCEALPDTDPNAKTHRITHSYAEALTLAYQHARSFSDAYGCRRLAHSYHRAHSLGHCSRRLADSDRRAQSLGYDCRRCLSTTDRLRRHCQFPGKASEKQSGRLS